MGKKMSPKIMRLFNSWYKEAKQKELNNPNAMSLATSTCFGVPSVRVVLLKSYNSEGFVFYTNIISQKGQELDTNPHASACFHWKSTNKQIRISGAVEQVGDEEIDNYFAGRPRPSQIGAWASKQSQGMANRRELELRVEKYTSKYANRDIPRPEFWIGFRIIPIRVEFWHEFAFRLHDREVFVLEDEVWRAQKLFP